MARRAWCGWVRSVLTQEVKAIGAAKPCRDAACPKMTSGQLPFLGSMFKIPTPWVQGNSGSSARPVSARSYRNRSTMARASMLAPCPTGPRRSAVLALTLT